MVEQAWVLLRTTGRFGNFETKVMGIFVDEDGIDDFLYRLYGLTEDELEVIDQGLGNLEYRWHNQFSDHYATLVAIHN